jgi:hypothetical protein
MKDKNIYYRDISYHDKDNVPQSSVLKISTHNGYVEFSMCNPDCQSDFNPKEGPQTELHKLWDDWHIKKYCELDNKDKIDELTTLCDGICDNVEEEEEEYLESLEEVTEQDVLDETNDERIIALIKHLNIEFKEYEDISEAKYGNNIYEYGNQEYQVLTDDEADREEEEYVENLIEECYIPGDTKNNPIYDYIDMDRWVKDWCGNRGENLNSFNGEEHYENVNGTTYYIYRKN